VASRVNEVAGGANRRLLQNEDLSYFGPFRNPISGRQPEVTLHTGGDMRECFDVSGSDLSHTSG
jgi:hypothetical protein